MAISLIHEDQLLLKTFQEQRNLKKRTMSGYTNSLRLYVMHQKTSFHKMLGEADYEEEQGIRWKKRKLKKRLIDFQSFLQNKYMYNAVRVHFQRIIALYKHFDIEIHNIPRINKKSCKLSRPVLFTDLLSKEEIRNACNLANPLMRALILFMSSSGCARKETLDLTIRDFINATKEYHGCDNHYAAISKLDGLDNVFPTFHIKRHKTNKYYYTFCSPEAVKMIVNYLKTRRIPSADEKLFKINLNCFNMAFKFLNTELKLGKVSCYNKFRSHMLRKFHASNLHNNGGMSRDEVDCLQGRADTITHQSYFFTDPNVLREKYIDCWESIRIFDDDSFLNISCDGNSKVDYHSSKSLLTKSNIYKYIGRLNGAYVVRKWVNGKYVLFYSSKNLVDVLVERDSLVNVDWNVDLWVEQTENYTYIPELLPEFRVKTSKYKKNAEKYIYESNGRFQIRKNNKYFGNFKTLDDAKEYRDLLMSVDWVESRLMEGNV